ncbi:thioesterase family protein [Nocardia sp. NPDC051929]|uniref:thioesterase family protein n=1 Tax=Nocardia sp. NPDC051929 TaxID=3364327 RepID=UPI0037C72C66
MSRAKVAAVRPEISRVLAVPAAFIREIPPEFEDGNRHMNVMHYFRLHGEAMWQQHGALGYTESGKFGLFAMEQHVAYYREVLVGHEVSVHVCDLGRTDKVARGISYLVNRTVGEVASSFEFLSMNVDRVSRRPAEFADTVAAALDESIARARSLGFGPDDGVLELRPSLVRERD